MAKSEFSRNPDFFLKQCLAQFTCFPCMLYKKIRGILLQGEVKRLKLPQLKIITEVKVE